MKTNYQSLMEDEIKTFQNQKKSLLLHACCGPCSSYVIELLNKYFEITVYYYNPNIYPKEEHNRRENELLKFASDFADKNKLSKFNIVTEPYKQEDFYNAIKGYEKYPEKSYRCWICYELRMKKALDFAEKNRFDYFTTTLSISPHKDAEKINEIGQRLTLNHNYHTKFLYSDFKKKNGYKRSLELSKEYNLYRQKYCGCIYSKLQNEERHERV